MKKYKNLTHIRCSKILFCLLLTMAFSCNQETNIEPTVLENEKSTGLNTDELKTQTEVFGDYMYQALEEQLVDNLKNARAFSKGIDVNLLQKTTLSRMEKSYPEFKEAFHKTQTSLEAKPSSRTLGEKDDVFSDEKTQPYLDEISEALFPAIEAFDKIATDSTDFDAFEAFYSERIDQIISDIASDEDLSDSTKFALTAAAYFEVNTLDTKIILALDAMGALSIEDFSGPANARIKGWLGNLFRSVWRTLTKPFRGNTWYTVKVFSSRAAIGAGSGALSGSAVTVGHPIGTISGAIVGGLTGLWNAYDYLRKNPRAC